MRRVRFACCAAFLLLGAIVGASTADPVLRSLTPNPVVVMGGDVIKVSTLPGWNGTLPMDLFSGFVNITTVPPPNGDMLMHYMLYGQEVGDGVSVEDADQGPIIVWYNGGPGAPSSWGTFIENGPLLLNQQSWLSPMYDEATGTPGLVRNEFAWTKFATLLAFANPPPTGFSQCNPPGPQGNGSACGVWNDTRVGVMNAEAIHTILTKHFPNALANPDRRVYIIGESYGGAYISATIQEIATNASYAILGSHIDGVALGDACMGTNQICGGIRGDGDVLTFLYHHGQYPTDMWETLNQKCTKSELDWGHASAGCQEMINTVFSTVGNYYVYNLYDNCPDNMFDAIGTTATSATPPRRLKPKARRSSKRFVFKSQQATTKLEGGKQHPPAHFNGYWCPGQVFERYMNLTSVRIALNVPVDANFFIEDDAVGMPYDLTLKDGFAYFAPLLQNKTSTGVPSTLTRPFRLMSYNGDSDACVTMDETEPVWYAFAKNYSFTKSEEWRSWVVESPGIVGGYIVQWFDSRVSYATVRGSGHMVPEYKPRAAAVLMSHFVKGEAPPKL